MEKLNEMETEENREYVHTILLVYTPLSLLSVSVLQQLRALVGMNESLKRQEAQFRAHCREEKMRLETGIARLQTAVGEGGSEDQVCCCCCYGV